MSQFRELQTDKSFRWRLIFACLAVAMLVSIIYVIVSYRLSADLGVQIELNSMEKQSLLLHAELLDSKDEPADKRIQDLAELVQLSEQIDQDAAFYIRVQGPDIDWSLNQNIPLENIDLIREEIKALHKISPSYNGKLDINDQSYLWQIMDGKGYLIDFYHIASSLDHTLSFIAKRLSITTIIVFWIAVWCALTLSFWMSKRVESKNDTLVKLATHDQLTGLPNRLYLLNVMHKDIPLTNHKDHDNYFEFYACLFMIDLDNFKEINDTLGHAAGDRLLQEIAKKLKSQLREEQTLVRTGGDEFVIWAPYLIPEEAKELAKNLIAVCDEPILINQLAVNTGASVGIAYYPEHGIDSDNLISSADNAMYRAKQHHMGWLMFSEVEKQNGHQRLKLRADLNAAFSEHQIRFYYQPKVDLFTGDICGVEALARWHHPEEGILTPYYFIDLIEQSGRVQEFGRYVIQAVINQLSVWQKQGASIPVAINLSPYNLLDPGLVDFIENLLMQYNVSPRMFEIELTERATSLNIDRITPKLDALKRLGIPLTIDDFGTGMSSLSYISNINVDIIKIDRCFIYDIDTNAKHRAIVSSITTLTEPLNCHIVAEGVETKEQAIILKELGCHFAQGYYFSYPLQVEKMTRLLQTSPYLPIEAEQETQEEKKA